MRGLLILVAAAACAFGGCEDDKRKASEEDAGKPEKPKGKEGDKCKSQEDCAFGFSCAKDDKTCQTPQTIDCRGRPQVCEREGRCWGAKTGGCIAKNDSDCKKAQVCKGQCTPKDGRCIAETDDDCKGSKRCEIYDQCKAEDGQCVE
jgi:hypothetical protein